MIVTRSLVNSKVRSDKLYGFIARYFMMLDYDVEASKTIETPLFFFLSLAKAYPSMD